MNRTSLLVLITLIVFIGLNQTTFAQSTITETNPIETTQVELEIAEGSNFDNDNLVESEITEINLPYLGDTGFYIEIIDGCRFDFAGECLNVRTLPSTDSAVVRKLRNQEILRVDKYIINDEGEWYRITYKDQHLYYPERANTEEYVSAQFVKGFLTKNPTTTWEHGRLGSNKHIIVDKSEQMLYAHEGNMIYMQTDVSTGRELTQTDNGTYEVFKKMPTRYMQGPIPGSGLTDVYDLEGVPWNLYFSADGKVIHGAYWHNSFGSPYSHGCVNLRPDDAEYLYKWADLGTTIEIRD